MLKIATRLVTNRTGALQAAALFDASSLALDHVPRVRQAVSRVMALPVARGEMRP